MNKICRFYLLIWLVIGLHSCKPAVKTTSSNTLTIRSVIEISGLNPVISNDVSSNLFQKLIPTLINFDPISLDLVPLLIDSLPQKITLDTGKYKGLPAYQFTLKSEARWPDGQPLLIKDYIFSLKVALNRKIINNSWTKSLSFIKDVIPIDNRTCIVVLIKDRPSSAAYFVGFELLAEHHYDPNHLLEPFALNRFVGDNFVKLNERHPEIEAFAQHFAAEKYIRDPEGIFGAGPYRLDKWLVNDRIVLVKKKNYWAEHLTDKKILLKGNPDTLIYKLVLDEISTVSYLKNRQLDLVSDVSPGLFVKLREDPNMTTNFDFYTPKTKEFYVIGLNNRSQKLNKAVRKAFAMSFDVDELVKVATEGLGIRAVGPINEESPYYNTSLKPIEKNLKKARELLKNDGWMDVDKDGVLEKMINGKNERLAFNLLSSNSIPFSSAIAPIIKNEAAKIGIKINILSEEWGNVVQNLLNRKYDMALYRLSSPPSDYQPYGTWHSDNTGKSGRNHTGYSSAKIDSIIFALQKDNNSKTKKELYLSFQETLFEDQPIVFLFYPVKTIIVNNQWKPHLSTMRPGYFENAFQLKNK